MINQNELTSLSDNQVNYPDNRRQCGINYHGESFFYSYDFAILPAIFKMHMECISKLQLMIAIIRIGNHLQCCCFLTIFWIGSRSIERGKTLVKQPAFREILRYRFQRLHADVLKPVSMLTKLNCGNLAVT